MPKDAQPLREDPGLRCSQLGSRCYTVPCSRRLRACSIYTLHPPTQGFSTELY